MPDDLAELREHVHVLYKEALEARRRARELERHYEALMRERYKPIPVMGCSD